MVENVIKTAGPTWQSRPSRRSLGLARDASAIGREADEDDRYRERGFSQ